MNTQPRDRGMVTIWVLGMVLVVAVIGWFGVASWSVFAERRELTAAADQAAQAGATALDADWFRATGERRLNPGIARNRAIDNLEQHDIAFDTNRSSVTAATDRVVVTLVKDSQAPLVDSLTDDPLVITVIVTGQLQGSPP